MKKLTIVLIIAICSQIAFSQNNVGIGTTTPNADAILELSSTNRGFLMPRVTSADTTGLGIPANTGMILYSNTDNVFFYYDGSNWQALTTGVNSWGENGNDIYNLNTGRVGIGTNTPQYLLDVVGSDGVVDGSSGVWAGIHNAVAGTGGVSSGILFDTYVDPTSAIKGGIFFRRSGAFGIGDLLFSTNGNVDASNIDASNAYVKMMIRSDGKVGIGTTTPNVNYKFTIDSDLLGGMRLDNNYTGTSAQYGFYNQLNPTGSGQVFGNYVNFSNTGTGQRYGTFQAVYAEAANTSPAFGTVNNVRANGTGEAQGFRAEMFGTGSGTNYGLYVFNSTFGTGTEYGVYTTGEDYNYFNGSLGIGITVPVYTLDVNGDINTSSSYFLSGNELISSNLSNGLYIGIDAGHTNAPSFSTFVGNGAGQNSTSVSNTFVGYQAGNLNTTGNQNVFVGLWAGQNNLGGNSNTFIGRSTGDVNSSGSDNVFLGRDAGGTNTTGSQNTLIGRGADVASNALVNSTALGYNAIVNTSNSLVLGNAVNVGIGTSSPTSKLHVDGGTTQGSSSALITSTDTWGTALNIAAAGGGSGYQLVAAGSAHPTLSAGSFAISNFATGNVFTIDGSSGDVSVGALTGVTTNKIGLGATPIGTSKVYISNTDNSFSDGLWVNNQKTSGTTWGIYLTAGNSGSATVYGIRGSASANGGTHYGVYGTASGTGTNYGVYCVGNGAYTGTWSFVSDENLKTNVRNYNGALQNIMKLEPKQYEYKTAELPYMNMIQGDQIGLIAQDVQKIFPHLVTQNVHPGPTDEKGRDLGQEKQYLGIDYIQLVPILTQAIKEQQVQMDLMRREIELLKSK